MKDDPRVDHTQFDAPHSLEAERMVLGSILVNTDQAPVVLEALRAENFYLYAHALIFRAMQKVSAESFGMSQVVDELTRAGDLKDVGGWAYLTGLSDGMPQGTDIDYTIGRIRTLARRRELVGLADAFHTAAQADDCDPASLLDTWKDKLVNLEARHAAATQPTLRPFRDGLSDTLDWIAEQHDGNPYIGLATGLLTTLDSRTLGLRGLIVLAAQPGIGKTAFGLDVGLATIRNENTACLIFVSLEMSARSMQLRMVSAASGLSWVRLVKGDVHEQGAAEGGDGLPAGLRLHDGDLWVLRAGVKALREVEDRIVLLDRDDLPRAGLTRPADWLRRVIDEAKRSTGAGRAFVLIDNLQSIPVANDPTTGRGWRTDLDRDRHIMAELLTVARTMPTDPLLVISEQSKAGFTAGGLDSVLGSGRAVYSPDSVWFLRDDRGADAAPEGNTIELDLVIAKSRDGSTRGAIPLTFNFRTCTYVENTGRAPFGNKDTEQR